MYVHVLWVWSEIKLLPTSEGLPGVLGNKGTLAKYRREQGNISQVLEQGNKIRKVTVRKHSERVWEHGNIGKFWKGTREQGPPPPGRPSQVYTERVLKVDGGPNHVIVADFKISK